MSKIGKPEVEASNEEKTKAEVCEVRKRTLLEVWEDFLYGYDFFVSYRWDDGRNYAVALAKALRKEFSVFLDSSEYAIGDSLSWEGNRAVRKTTRMILVATPGVAKSDHIKRELRAFRGTNRRLIAIDFKDTFNQLRASDKDLKDLLSEDELRLVERNESADVEPDPTVVTSIKASLATETKRTRRKKAIGWACAALVTAILLAVVSGVLAVRYYQYKQAQRYLTEVLKAEVDDEDANAVKVTVTELTDTVDVAKLVKSCNTIGETRHLEITNSELSGTAELGELQQMVYLNLYQSIGVDSLAFVKHLPVLEDLKLNGTKIGDRHLKTLRSSGKLRDLNLNNNEKVSGDEIARILHENPGLKKLTLYGCQNFTASPALAAAIRTHADGLRNDGQLFYLDLGKTAVRSAKNNESVLKVFHNLRTEGHRIEGLTDPNPDGGISNDDSRDFNVVGCLRMLDRFRGEDYL